MTKRQSPHPQTTRPETTRPETTQEALSALLDGQIGSDQSRELLVRLAEDPALAAELADLRRQDAALRAAFELPPGDRASPPATRALERLLASSFQRRSPRRQWIGRIAAALLLAFGLGAATGWWSGTPATAPADGYAATPAPQPTAASLAAAPVIDAIGIRVPDLSDLGMTLVALGSRSMGSAQLLEFHYALGQARTATVLVGSDRQVTIDRLMQIGTGASGAWQDGPLTIAVAGITDNRLLSAVVEGWSGSTAATAEAGPAPQADRPTPVAEPSVATPRDRGAAGVEGVAPAVAPQPDALPAPVAPVLEDVIDPEADPEVAVEPEVPAPS